jgi:hypothetical protein
VTEYGSPTGVGGTNATESSVTVLSPNASIVARDLSVKLTAAPGVGSSRTFALSDDGTPTAVACTISGAATTCDSGVATATIGAGSELSIELTVSVVPALASALVGWNSSAP